MARIVIAADTFPPHIGGSEQQLSAMASALAVEHEVVVYTPASTRGPEHDQAFDLSQPYQVHRSKLWSRLFAYGGSRNSVISRNARMLIVFLTYVKMSGLCRNTELLIIGHALPLGAVATALKKRYPKLKTLLVTYGEEIAVYSRGPRMKGMLKQLLESVDCVTATTIRSGEILTELAKFKRPPDIIPPPVSADFLDIQLQQITETRDILGVDDRRLMLTVCRLVPRKGIDTAIHAFARIHESYPDLVYLVLGFGPDESRLKALANAAGLKDKVRFLTVPDTKPYYHSCDFFIMPNRTMPDGEQEGFGIVFLEAALAGKPSIAGNSGGVPDAVLHGKTGLLVDPTDIDAVATAMKRFLDDPAQRHQMGSAARDFAQNFTTDRIAAGYIALIRDVLNTSSQGPQTAAAADL